MSISTYAQAVCEQKENLTVNVLELNRQTILNEIDTSENSFCDKSLAGRFLRTQVTKIQADEILEGKNTLHFAEKKAFGKISENAHFDTWNNMLVPSDKIRRMAADKITIFDNSKSKFESMKQISLEEAIQLLQLPKCELKGFPNSSIDNDLKKTGLSLKNIGLATRYSCQEILGVFKLNSCNEPFRVINRIASPNKLDDTGVEIYERVLSDSRYDEGLRIAALLIASRVKQGITKKSDYFSDIKNSFMASGFDETQAEEFTWNVIGMISTSGPNTAGRMNALIADDGSQNQKRLAISTIIAALPILDHRSSKLGKLYSLPNSVISACNSGKSYHFWYAAYLSRRATLETKNPEGAAVMSFQASKYYHVVQRNFSHTKNVTKSLIDSPLFSESSNVSRMDLSLSAAGALFGAHKATVEASEVNLNVTNTFKQLIANAGKGEKGITGLLVEKAAGSTASQYHEWMKKFDANAAFSYLHTKPFGQKVRTEYLSYEKTPYRDTCK